LKIHIDIDCFFASAARIDDPTLVGKPIAIGGRSDTKIFTNNSKHQVVDFQNTGSFVPTFYKAYEKSDDINAFKDEDGRIRGILTTSSYEAREYGIKTAMSINEALALCPHLIIKSPNMSLYQELSNKLYEYLCEKIPLVEQASIDEFYGDLSGWVKDEDVEDFIYKLRDDILKIIKLPVSIGSANSKYIAKLATTFAKPYGCKIIYDNQINDFIEPIAIKSFAGIGKSMTQKLESVHIHTLGELRRRRGIVESWGPYAIELYKRVCGFTDAPIKTTRKRKSIGISRTFDAIFSRNELRRRIHILTRHLSYAILKLDVIPTVFHLSIDYEMNQKTHKNVTLCELFNEKTFDNLCINMFNEADIHKRDQVIRLGISCSSFTRDSKKELSLIGFDEQQKLKKLTNTTQLLREKYGIDSLKWGGEF